MSNTVKIRVSLVGTLRNAARHIEQQAAAVRERDAFNPDDEGEMRDDPAGQADYEAFVLREIADHAEGVRKGEHSLEDFADHYCLTERTQ